jgi:nucleoside-diphosphate-sugar epimerase
MGVPLTVWKTAQYQLRPYLSLIDASNAIAHVIKNRLYEGTIYNVLTANSTVDQIIQMISIASSKKCTIQFVEDRIMNQLSYEVSSMKFQNTGFEFVGSLKNDVTDTMNLLSGVNSA